ncbi:MAG: class I SAM-dependent RNA methyltransferase, partial [Streptosporangiaceae bacterium]
PHDHDLHGRPSGVLRRPPTVFPPVTQIKTGRTDLASCHRLHNQASDRSENDEHNERLRSVSEELELTVTEPAHGGWCVARIAGVCGEGDAGGAADGPGKVVFVRHALPGERIRARITSSTARFARAEAIEVLDASPDRVEPPCRYARPGGCGGCDLQHASPAAQRAIKAQVISQQLRRMAGIDREVKVEALPPAANVAEVASGAGEDENLGWRTRVGFAVRPDGTAGLRKHRSREVIAIDDCLIAHAAVREAGVPQRRWPGARGVDVSVAAGTGERSVVVTGRGGPGPESRRFVTQQAAGRTWRVSSGVFWQVHPAAADTLTEAVLGALRPAPGDVALDLYCGAGLFAGALAGAVGASGQVIGVESEVAAVRDARKNLAGFPQARIHRGDAVGVLEQHGLGEASLAVLDPPRAGVPRQLIELVGGQFSRLRRIAYVSCDPATLARDIAVFAELNWRVDDLRAFDAFPMTHHVECLATLVPAS